MSLLEEELRKIAEEFHFHFAFLEGSRIHDQISLMLALAKAYNFPNSMWPDPKRPNWDSMNEWMGDLTWITASPRNTTKIQGFLLFFSNPSRLFAHNATDLAIFLNIISNTAREFAQEKVPFHLVLGPLGDKARVLVFLLKVADSICPSDHSAMAELP